MFQLFKKARAPAPEPAQPPREPDPLERVMHCPCEVRTMDDRPMFLGRLQDYAGDSVRVYSQLELEVPQVIYGNPYKLVFHTPQRPVPVWTGRVCGSTHEFWKLAELSRFRDEQRAGFRQRLAQAAGVMPLTQAQWQSERGLSAEDLSHAYPCQVVDLSLGGLQFLCHGLRFKAGQVLAVTALRLTHDPAPFTLPLQVRWTEDAGPESCRCGCAFRDLDRQEETRLCAAIFSLQRAALAYR